MAQGNLFIVIFPMQKSIIDRGYSVGTYETFTQDRNEALSRFEQAKGGLQQYRHIYEIADYAAALTEHEYRENKERFDQEFESIEEIKELVKEVTTKEVTVETEIEVVNC